MRMIQRALGLAYNRWIEWYDDLMEQKRVMAKAMAKWVKQKLSAAWNTWVSKMVRDGDILEGEEEDDAEPSGLEFVVPWTPSRKRPSRWDIKAPKVPYQSKAYRPITLARDS